jgi:hypothetical protein
LGLDRGLGFGLGLLPAAGCHQEQQRENNDQGNVRFPVANHESFSFRDINEG